MKYHQFFRGNICCARTPVLFQGQAVKVALDQLRTVDRTRLVRKLGSLSAEEATLVLDCLGQMFAI